MSTEKTQSAIKEVRDQIMLDSADGPRLTTVTDNLGFSRPRFGFSNDNEWRALAKQLALGPKQIEKSFRKILEICIGPDFDRTAVISTAVVALDTTISLEDASELPQVGTIVLSPGLAATESAEYCFIDYATNKVFLESPVANAHVVLAAGSTVLSTDAVATAVSLVLADSSVLPTSGYPFTISIGKGTILEETVTVSLNVPATNTLTVSALANDHTGFKAGYLRRELLAATIAGRTFLQFDTQDTENFPDAGWIRIDAGLGAEEIVFFDENAFSDNILHLKTPLANAHIAAASVELLFPGELVSTVSVLQAGIHWSIFDTTHDEVKVLVPESIVDLQIQNASWVHDPVPAVLGSTTLAVATVAADTVIEIASASNFPDEAGMLTIDGTERFFYTLRDEAATPNPTLTLTKAIGAIYSIGTTVVLFEVPYGGTLLEEGNPRDVTGAVIDDRFPGPYVFDLAERGVGTVSTTVTSLHPAATAMVVDMLIGRETIECNDLSLWDPAIVQEKARVGRGTGFEEDLTVIDVTLAVDTIGSIITGGPWAAAVLDAETSGAGEPFPETVGVSTSQYSVLLGASVVSGNSETYALSDGQTLTVAVDGAAAQTATFNTADFSNIALADADEVAAVITTDISGATSVDLDVGGTIIIFSTVGTSIEVTGGTANGVLGFPTSVVVEEKVVVVDESLAATVHTLTVSATLLRSHDNGESVRLVNDVLTVDPTTKQHLGPSFAPTVLGHPVEFLTDTISLTSSVAFSSVGGHIILNFGDARLPFRSRLNTIVSPTVYQFDDTSGFPTADFPYQIVLSQGTEVEELINVNANNTGLNRLTFSTTPVNIHPTGPAPFGGYAAFVTGGMEFIEYQSVVVNDIILTPAQVIGKHTIGELAITSPEFAIPRVDGFSYPLLLPPDSLKCVKDMFEVVRAAGIQVTIIPF